MDKSEAFASKWLLRIVHRHGNLFCVPLLSFSFASNIVLLLTEITPQQNLIEALLAPVRFSEFCFYVTYCQVCSWVSLLIDIAGVTAANIRPKVALLP